MMNWITTFLFLTSMPATLNQDKQPDDTQLGCTPFNAIIIWHTGDGHNTSFVREMHFIIKMIRVFPEGTEVSLVTVGSKITTKLHFRKDMTDDSWITALSNHNPGESGTHIILNRKISDAILKYENPQLADKVFLVVDNRSVIANEQKAAITLGKKNTSIILYGEQTMKHGWAKLATNTRHFVLEDDPDTINNTVNSILIQTCRETVPDTESTKEHTNYHIDVHSTINTILLVLLITFNFLREPVIRRLLRKCIQQAEKECDQDENQSNEVNPAREGSDSESEYISLTRVLPSPTLDTQGLNSETIQLILHKEEDNDNETSI